MTMKHFYQESDVANHVAAYMNYMRKETCTLTEEIDKDTGYKIYESTFKVDGDMEQIGLSRVFQDIC